MDNLTTKLRALTDELDRNYLPPCPNNNHLWKPFGPDIYKCALCGDIMIRITHPDTDKKVRCSGFIPK